MPEQQLAEENKQNDQPRMKVLQEIHEAMSPQQKQFARQLFDTVKSGDVEEVVSMTSGVDIRDLVSEEAGFYQNAMFFACQIKNESDSLRMVEVLM